MIELDRDKEKVELALPSKFGYEKVAMKVNPVRKFG